MNSGSDREPHRENYGLSKEELDFLREIFRRTRDGTFHATKLNVSKKIYKLWPKYLRLNLFDKCVQMGYLKVLPDSRLKFIKEFEKNNLPK